jgi:coenzyme PQQ precursor peptide PqqA
MCTNTSSSAQASVATDQTRQQPQLWAKPRFLELRLGFEVTLYSEYR